ncbi:hypothetical protein BpHYR1_026160 [Brachionus plicatilis]|uniref:Uncharacterized protein n=1 Tax=Brachionus plicatilis TaxID=10195 RepID=A0A3M7T7E7_BRAPC|nr:hypothetical protein BpHYR1_026160 [Brachionus plicatilis]
MVKLINSSDIDKDVAISQSLIIIMLLQSLSSPYQLASYSQLSLLSCQQSPVYWDEDHIKPAEESETEMDDVDDELAQLLLAQTSVPPSPSMLLLTQDQSPCYC